MVAIATENVLVTDIVGSTSVLAGEGVLAAEGLRHRHDAVVRAVVGVFGGRIVKSTGDGVLALMPSADHLIRTAAALQQAAVADELPLRVGVATGDVVHEDGDCFGEAVVVAFRLCEQCPPRMALVDSATALIRGRRRDPPVESYARLLLRGFEQPSDVFAVAATDEEVTGREPATAPLVGRVDALARVESAWRSSDRRFVVLSGVPGIGKTHLAAALADSAKALPWWVAFEPQQTDGFARWCTTLDERAAQLPVGVLAALGSVVVGRLAALLPSIAERLPVEPAQLSADSDRQLSFDALIELVRVAGRDALVVCDDVQWAGATFHAFLAALTARHDDVGLNLLATCRPPVPAGLRGLEPVVVHLDGLSDHEVGEILTQRGVPPADAVAAARTSGGNPFLALIASRPGPTQFDDLMASRLLAVPSDTVEVLGVAALIGRTVDLPLTARVANISVDDVVTGLEPAVGAGLLRQDGDTLVFLHDLVREAVERQLPVHRVTFLHARAADALQARGDVTGAIRHCLAGFRSLEPDDAVELVTTGCATLFERQAFEDVLDIARRLADVVRADDRCRPRHLAAALLLESEGYHLLGDIGAHKQAALAAGRAALDDGDHRLLAAAAIERVMWGIAGVPDPEALNLLDQALARIPPEDEATRSQLMSMRAFYLINYESKAEEARRWSAEALTVARSSGDLAALRTALDERSFVLNAGSRVVEQLAVLDELAAMSAGPVHPPATSWTPRCAMAAKSRARPCIAMAACCACSWVIARASPSTTLASPSWQSPGRAGCWQASPRCGTAWSRCWMAHPTAPNSTPGHCSSATTTTSPPAQPAYCRRRIAGAERSPAPLTPSSSSLDNSPGCRWPPASPPSRRRSPASSRLPTS